MLGRVHIEKGYYIYVGSARGPGGVRARLRRHFSRDKKPWWHIDYLLSLPTARPMCALYACTEERVEPLLALACSERLGYVEKFGSTDDRLAPSHLFYSEKLDEVLSTAWWCMDRLGLLAEVFEPSSDSPCGGLSEG